MEDHTTGNTNETNYSTIAGVLDIVSGVGSLIGSIALIVLSGVIGGLPQAIPEDVPVAPFMAPALIFFLLASLLFLTGALAIVGGISALKKQRWGLAIFGAICAIFCLFPLGIPAIILTVMSEKEFQQNR